jgi:hypothetical protein
MTDVADRVLAETRRFHQALPALLQSHRGRWVVFFEGRVQSQHASEEAAYESAVNAYGVEGGFVVAQVDEVRPTAITAAAVFGLP